MGFRVHTRGVAKLTGGRLAAARAFKAARGRKGMSQEALAEAAGVALGVVQEFELGNTWPRAKSQAALEPILRMPSGELERIAAAYAERGPLQDEETWLIERLSEIRRLMREGVSHPSHDTAARIQALKADRERIDTELERLEHVTD